MLQLIQTFKQRRRLKKLRKQYNDECNDLASFKNSLPRAIRKGDDTLSSALRDAIVDSHAECDKLKNKITILRAYISGTSQKNATTTGG